jgi:predicted transcriptional regulator
LEHEVMDALWARGGASADQIREGLARRLKDSTVRTILRRLEDKGYVKHRVEGRTYIYSGAEARENIAVRAVRQIIDRFCQGSVEQLLAGMVENEVVDRAELQRLARKIAQKPRREE